MSDRLTAGRLARGAEVRTVAADVRSRRRSLRAALTSGRQRLKPLVGAPPWWMRTAEVGKLLSLAPEVDEQTAEAILDRAGVPAEATFSKLSLRQRTALIEELNRIGGGA